ncbi:hypothetical protein EOS_03410 [Caballeronia mineralivorans PML1(12)]|uniref:Uncharacterized protein n=2 Tax=Caballeronia mineralivorans TaxID=2010198 RepID=A0A0J1D4N7_9BURK|nr:hypothetical protein EOS_03410 [Caballeronia mineralivorans PML1(12)]
MEFMEHLANAGKDQAPVTYTDVPVSYHPLNIDSIEGVDEETAPYVKPAKEALALAYVTLNQLNEARRALVNDESLTEGAKLLKLADFAGKHQETVSRKFDAVHQNLTAGINDLERQLNAPVAEAARISPFAPDIRNHVKALSFDKQHEWINEMIKKDDRQSLNAVLGAPAFLSGLTDEWQKIQAKRYHKAMNPGLTTRLDVMIKAREKIETVGAQFVHTDVEKSLGHKHGWREVQRLRAVKVTANDPFKF